MTTEALTPFGLRVFAVVVACVVLYAVYRGTLEWRRYRRRQKYGSSAPKRPDYPTGTTGGED